MNDDPLDREALEAAKAALEDQSATQAERFFAAANAILYAFVRSSLADLAAQEGTKP